jgi:biotin carboxyl carrier protein
MNNDSIRAAGKIPHQNDPSVKRGKNYILAIGIDDYTHCPKLKNAVKDIKDFVTLLTDKFGFHENSHITFLCNDEATSERIFQALEHLIHTVEAVDNVLIYFSGHGEFDKVWGGYWIPFEAKQGNRKDYISNNDIQTALLKINSFHTFLIADSCYSGSLFLDGKGKFVSDSYDFPSRWGLTSGRNTIVSDGKAGTNSPFAAALLSALGRLDSPMNVSALCDLIKQAVPAATNKLQTPIGDPLSIKGHEGGQFVFYPKIKINPEITHWEAAKAENTEGAYTRYLRQYKQGQFAHEAEAALEVLEKQKEIAKEDKFWQEATEKNTSLGYLRYLRQYPQGRFVQEADDRLDAIENKENVEKQQRDEAERARKAQLAHQEAEQKERARQEIERKQREQEAEERLWRDCQAKSTPSVYLTQYPNGRFAEQAFNQIRIIDEIDKLEITIIDIKVPAIAESVTEVTLSQWLKRDGDFVKLDEPICEFESDKATLELPAEVTGRLEHLAKEGEDLPIGAIIAKIHVGEQREDLIKDIICIDNIELEMITVKGGSFLREYTYVEGEKFLGLFSNKVTKTGMQKVHLSTFSIGKYPVTQAQWQAVMSNNPSHFKGNNLPVEKVTWDDCQAFIEKLNKKTGKKYRLPTEAEWEFAAAGGNQSKGYLYSGSNSGDEVAWYNSNSESKTHPVGTKKANELGIHDMSGNVWEWCQDWYGAYESTPAITNPTGGIKGLSRIARGGSWGWILLNCHVANRYHYPPLTIGDALGFRLVSSL